MFVAKISFALVSILFLVGLMWLVALWLSGGQPFGMAESNGYTMFGVGLGFFGLGMLLWTTLFSLLLKRVIVAAILGVAAASLHLELANSFTGVGVALVVLVADCCLGIRWFREKRDRRATVASTNGDGKNSPQEVKSFGRILRPDRTAVLARLVWQHCRQSAGLMIVLAGSIVLLAAFPAGKLAFGYYGFLGLGRVNEQPLFLLALACVPLLGACAFLPDQWDRGYRFLSARGVSPKYVWLSRQLVALVPMALILSALLFFAYFLAPDSYTPGTGELVRRPMWTLAYVSGYVVLGYAVGQLCSMFFRSTVLAGLFSVLLSAILSRLVVPDDVLARQLALVGAADPTGHAIGHAAAHGQLAIGAKHAPSMAAARADVNYYCCRADSSGPLISYLPDPRGRPLRLRD